MLAPGTIVAGAVAGLVMVAGAVAGLVMVAGAVAGLVMVAGAVAGLVMVAGAVAGLVIVAGAVAGLVMAPLPAPPPMPAAMTVDDTASIIADTAIALRNVFITSCSLCFNFAVLRRESRLLAARQTTSGVGKFTAPPKLYVG